MFEFPKHVGFLRVVTLLCTRQQQMGKGSCTVLLGNGAEVNACKEVNSDRWRGLILRNIGKFFMNELQSLGVALVMADSLL